MEQIRHYASPLGGITLSARDGALTGLWFDDQKYYMETLREAAAEDITEDTGAAGSEGAVLSMAEQWLDIYFTGRDPGFTPPLRPAGTPFRREVWEKLLTVPYGETRTYGQIAGMLQAEGKKTSARAVGGAVGHNPVSLIIPCHRIVGSSGSLTGYAGGLIRKRALLELESGIRQQDIRLRQ